MAITMKRQSNIEFLRIISMFMIILCHSCVHTHYSITTDFTFNKFFLQLLEQCGKIGVDLFVMISGYFLIHEQFRIVKFKHLFCQIYFYSIAILLFAIYINIDSVNSTEIVRSVLPFGLTNWFASIYLILYLFFPILNKMFLNMNKDDYARSFILGIAIWFLVPSILNIIPDTPYVTMGMSEFLLFVYLYGIGAYIRIFGNDWIEKRSALIFLVGVFGICMIASLIDFFQISNPLYLKKIYFLGEPFSLFPLLIAMVIFSKTVVMEIQYNFIINKIASLTFGIYLIHDNELLRVYIWNHVLNLSCFYGNLFLLLHILKDVVAVFVICGCIDYLRQQLFRYFKV